MRALAGEPVKSPLLTRARENLGIRSSTARLDSRIIRLVRKYPELERWSQRALESAAEALLRDACDQALNGLADAVGRKLPCDECLLAGELRDDDGER